MRKILFTFSAGFICVLSSCNHLSGGNDASADTQKNIDASRTISKAFDSGDTSKINDVVAADFVDHSEKGDTGRDSLKAMITWMHKNFADMKSETLKELADKDYVFTWMKFTGTNTASDMMPKGPYNMTAIEASKFKDGKAVEHWSFVDWQDVMKMMPSPTMGGMPMDQKMEKKDSAAPKH